MLSYRPRIRHSTEVRQKERGKEIKISKIAAFQQHRRWAKGLRYINYHRYRRYGRGAVIRSCPAISTYRTQRTSLPTRTTLTMSYSSGTPVEVTGTCRRRTSMVCRR
uniref:Uncharacterized protein n=1 Tax=Anopheles atroparvus TaxID=41427 RepID=A0AAG5DM90_ANOAO